MDSLADQLASLSPAQRQLVEQWLSQEPDDPPAASATSTIAEDSIHLPMTAVVFIPLYPNESWKILEAYFEGPAALNPEIVKQSIRYVHEFHEALRLRYVRDDRAGFWPAGLESGWKLRFAAPDSCDPFLYVDLSDLNSYDQDRRIGEIATMQRNTLNVVEGPVILLIYFNLGQGKPIRLLLLFHHAVMDGHALSIVLEDIRTVYLQIIQRQAIHITKTTSYSVWAEQIHRYMTSERMSSDVAFWSSLPWAEIGSLPQDYTEEMITNTSILSVFASLEADKTNDLLHKAPSFYNMELIDILVAALVLVLARWSGLELIIIAVLSHGRDILDGIDVSRTVGCMSTSNREMLHIDTSTYLINTLYSIKEQRRSMPSRGKLEGWTTSMYWREIPGNRPHAQLNYLGMIHKERKDDRDMWREIPFIPRAEDKETRFTPWTTLDCRAYILNGMFVIQWQYSELLYKRSTIEGLAEQYISILRSIIAALAAHRQS
jgi:non-ribosomal peptide synthase protein (TIGR01720 family)